MAKLCFPELIVVEVWLGLGTEWKLLGKYLQLGKIRGGFLDLVIVATFSFVFQIEHMYAIEEPETTFFWFDFD